MVLMKDAIGARIKRYEQVYNHTLTPRSCLFIRVDGKAFHTYTRGMSRPFDERLIDAMQYAASKTVEHMQGCKGVYIQSDECTFMLTDFDELETQGWFNYELNKVVSITASAYTLYFNEHMRKNGITKPALFDCRAFIVPKDDAPNVFIWRQRDWQRNSVQMLARAHFSQKELNGKKVSTMLQMLHDKEIDWGALSGQLQNGTFMFSHDDFYPWHDSLNYDNIWAALGLETLGKEE